MQRYGNFFKSPNYSLLYYIFFCRVVCFLEYILENGPELGGRNTNPSNRSMNSLRSNSISHFVAQIAHRNQRLNIDSKDLHSSKDLLVRSVFENIFEKLPSPLSSRLSDGAVRGKLSLLKLSRVATEFDVVKRKRMERSHKISWTSQAAKPSARLCSG